MSDLDDAINRFAEQEAQARAIEAGDDPMDVLNESQPSPAQPTEASEVDALAQKLASFEFPWNPLGMPLDRITVQRSAARELIAAGFRLTPSPVQGADDRLAAAEAVIERAKELLVPGGDGLEAAEWLAAYSQNPEAALNEVRATALEDAADNMQAGSDIAYFLRRRAAEIRTGSQADGASA